MYEIKSNGTTIEFTKNHKEALSAYDSCSARDKQLLKFISPINKVVVLKSNLFGAKHG